jgi:hypothetical protein
MVRRCDQSHLTHAALAARFGKEAQSSQRREIMVKKSRIALIAAAAALNFVSPALAQSFNPDFGTGNELPSQYRDSGKLVRGHVARSRE